MSDSRLPLPLQRAAQVLSVTALAWGVAAPSGSAWSRRTNATAARAAAACRDRRSASPSRLRLSAHGFDISY